MSLKKILSLMILSTTIVNVASPIAKADDTETMSSFRSSKRSRSHTSSSDPTVGIQIMASPSNMGNRSFNFKSITNNYSTTSLDLGGSYYIPFQMLGALNLGPTLKADLARSDGKHLGIKSNLVSAWAVGGNIQYQAKYFDRQLIVPTIGFSAERWFYQLISSHGNFNAWGPTAGVLLNLNSLDESMASSMYHQTRISRTYLVAEYQRIQGATPDRSASVTGENVHLGLRFEL